MSLRISKPAALLIALLAGAFCYYSRLPLQHTDVWGHLAYGRWIVEQRRLPRTDPFLPLARGNPVVDTAWLSQVAAYGVETAGGPAALVCLHAAGVVAGCGLLAAGTFRHFRRIAPALIAGAALLAIEWFQFRVARPQTAGVVCFIALEVMLLTRGGRRVPLWTVPLIFVLWANLHGSFVSGLALLASCTIGRAIDVASHRAGREGVISVVRDRRARRWAWATLLAAIVPLINPYGPSLYVEVLTFVRNPNLPDIIEWGGLDFRTWQGRVFLLATVLVTITAPAARRKCSAIVWLPLILFGIATLRSARMIVWWGPLAAWCLAVHANAILIRWHTPANSRQAFAAKGENQQRGSFLWTGTAAGAILLAIAGSPLVDAVRPSAMSDLRKVVSTGTPVEAAAWLRDHPPAAPIFNAYEWGDYLVWAGPPGLEVFVTSQVQLIPADVWRDYRSISRGDADALDRLDAYQVRAAVIDVARQSGLSQSLAADSRWRLVYADRQARIFSRGPQ